MHDLDLIAEGDDLDVHIAQPPSTIDDNLAARLVAKRRHILREQAEFDAVWNEHMEPLLLHRQHVTERNAAKVKAIEDLLARELEARRAANEKVTKVDLPGATLRSRVQGPTWEYDVDTFVAWAEEYGRDELLRTKVEVDKVAVKQSRSVALPDGNPGDSVQPIDPTTGEVIPGVKVTYRPRKLVIES